MGLKKLYHGILSTIYCNLRESLKPVDLMSAAYLILTGIYILAFINELPKISSHLIIRLGMLLIMVYLVCFKTEKLHSMKLFFRNFYPLIFILYLYGETAYMNHLIFKEDFDPVFIYLDNLIFGFQPSLEFSKRFNASWFNELMNFAYFSYYFLAISICILIYFFNKKKSDLTIFIIINSFYLYYIFYIIFPVVGPQYYFKPPLNQIPDAYIFREGVKLIQKLGEQPTAAFPSSHIGISLIISILSFKYLRKYFYATLPIIILLCFSTIYIKAHYFTDVLGGILSGIILFYLSSFIFKKLKLSLRT